MRHDRFQLISKFLQCNDNKEGHGPSHKFRQIVDLVNHKWTFPSAYDIAKDESMVGIQGTFYSRSKFLLYKYKFVYN